MPKFNFDELRVLNSSQQKTGISMHAVNHFSFLKNLIEK